MGVDSHRVPYSVCIEDVTKKWKNKKNHMPRFMCLLLMMIMIDDSTIFEMIYLSI